MTSPMQEMKANATSAPAQKGKRQAYVPWRTPKTPSKEGGGAQKLGTRCHWLVVLAVPPSKNGNGRIQRLRPWAIVKIAFGFISRCSSLHQLGNSHDAAPQKGRFDRKKERLGVHVACCSNGVALGLACSSVCHSSVR